jgi:predicted Zn-dependent protease
MNVKRCGWLLTLAAVAALQTCSTVPITGRKQFALLPNSQLLSMSLNQYGQFLKQNKLSGDAAQSDLVKQVGRRIQGAVETYFAQHNLSGELKGYAWEFNLVENPEVNAWCMPGGKVVVYTGILPFTQNDNGLAVVMGHEIAHAVARHGNERMSQMLAAQLGGLALNEALSQKPQQTRALWMTAFGAGVQVGALLPFSRLQESEADRLGLIFMAMAGYDPAGAVAFWTRMSQKAGGKPPEFLSTHPADATRIQKIKSELPEAMTYYQNPR